MADTTPDPAHCYVCERIALRPETLTLADLSTLTHGALIVRDMHVARVSDAEYLRRTRTPEGSSRG